MAWLLLLVACRHTLPPPPWRPPALTPGQEQDRSAPRSGMQEADGDPLGPESVGQEVVIKGYAQDLDQGGGAVIWGDEATLCDAVEAWPREARGQWVTLRGTLAPAPPLPPLKDREIRFYEPEYQVEGCTYSVGAEEADVLPADRVWLAKTGVLGSEPRIGQPVTFQGRLSVRRGYVFLHGEGAFFALACEGAEGLLGGREEILVRASGTLGYWPPLLRPGDPSPRLVATRMPKNGWFTIEGCTLREIAPEDLE